MVIVVHQYVLVSVTLNGDIHASDTIHYYFLTLWY